MLTLILASSSVCTIVTIVVSFRAWKQQQHWRNYQKYTKQEEHG